MKSFDAVVLDMDGVIFDSERAVLDVWKELAEKYGIDGIEAPLIACIGTTAAKTREIMLEAFGEDFPYDRYAREASFVYHERYDEGRLPLKPFVFELLEFLKHAGKTIALASSTRKEVVVKELGAAGILDYFDAVVTGDMAARSKPEPDIYLLALSAVGVSPERAYAVEDSYNGIRSAYRGGLRPIMVPDMVPADEEMRSLSEAVLPDLGAVLRYLGDEGSEEAVQDGESFDRAELIRTAMNNLKYSYAPYSGYNVSSAVLMDSGRVYCGVNVENASYPAGICAERNAIFHAVGCGERKIRAIAIVGGPHYGIRDYCAPCGICRQVMREFGDPAKMRVIFAKSPSDYKDMSLEELLPESFGPDSLV